MNKGLEALERMSFNLDLENDYSFNGNAEEDFDIVAKELKALEIIKEKNVDIVTLKIAGCLERYNQKRICGFELIQEEFDLLKEVLL